MLPSLVSNLEDAASWIATGVSEGDSARLREAWDTFLRLLMETVICAEPKPLRYASALLTLQLTKASRVKTAAETRYFIGALWSLKKAFDGLANRTPTEVAIQALRSGKYAEQIIVALAEKGICRASELCQAVGIEKYQLTEVAEPLLDAGLLQVEAVGRNRFYSLSGDGLLLARYLDRTAALPVRKEPRTKTGMWSSFTDTAVPRPILLTRPVQRIDRELTYVGWEDRRDKDEELAACR